MAGHPTLILGQAEIAEIMSLSDYFDAAEQAFERYAEGRMSVPGVVQIEAPDGAFHVKSAGFVGSPAYVAVKVNGNFPNNPRLNGLPTIQGAIILCDGQNGSLLAVIDSIEVTAMRTAAATAVAVKHLTQRSASVVTVAGCGTQGRVQLLALAAVLPLRIVHAFDADPSRANAFAEQMHRETDLEVVAVADLQEAARASQVIVTCTSSRAPFLGRQHVSPGTFIAAVGADNHNKQELDPDLLANAKVFVDVLEQCAAIGELHHAIKAGVMTQADVAGELGAVLAKKAYAKFSPDDIVIFDSTGSAFQDVTAAGIVYERARTAGIGSWKEFG
jgi:ornithine cyclodeaminase/alanine dehydrogenase-like protein (mu-crystallin family)